MLGAIRDRLSEFSALKEGAFSESLISCIADSGEKGMHTFPQMNMTRKIRLTQIEEEIEELLSKVSGAGSVLMKYLDEKVSVLDAERKALQEEIAAAGAADTKGGLKQITNHVKAWDALSPPGRKEVVDTLIKVIKIADGGMEITWNI